MWRKDPGQGRARSATQPQSKIVELFAPEHYTLRPKFEINRSRSAACFRMSTLAVPVRNATGLTDKVWCSTSVGMF